jgi:hypothetical protein
VPCCISIGCLVRALIKSSVIIGNILSSIIVEIYIYNIAVNILFLKLTSFQFCISHNLEICFKIFKKIGSKI